MDTEDQFYTRVRENVIALLLYLGLFGFAHWFTERYRAKPFVRRRQNDHADVPAQLKSYTADVPSWRRNDTARSSTTTRGRSSSVTISMQPPRVPDEDLLEAASPYYYGVLGLVPNLICSAALAVALAGFVLPPVTIVISGWVHSLPDRAADWLQWLDASLLTRLWRYTFHGIHISLFLLVPFAYFYSEADTVRGAAAKARESAITLIMTIVLGYGFIFVSKQLLDANQVSDIALLELMTTGASAVLCLFTAPRGFMEIFTAVRRLPLRPTYRRRLQDRLVQLQFEREVAMQRLDSCSASTHKNSEAKAFTRIEEVERGRLHGQRDAPYRKPVSVPSEHERDLRSRSRRIGDTPATPTRHRLRSSSWAGRDSPGFVRTTRQRRDVAAALHSEEEGIVRRLEELESERREAQSNLERSPMRRNLTFLLLFFLTSTAWCVHVILVTLSLVHGLLPNSKYNRLADIFHGTISFNAPYPSPNSTMEDHNTFPPSPLSLLLGEDFPILEASLIVYFSVAVVAGVASSTTFSSLRPRRSRTATREMSGFVAMLLFLASSVPAVIRILGLSASVPVPGELNNAVALLGGKFWLAFGYRLVMLVRTTYYMLDLLLASKIARPTGQQRYRTPE